MASLNGQTKKRSSSSSSNGPRTRQEKTLLKKSGNLLGWFGKLPVGRPPKRTLNSDDDNGGNGNGSLSNKRKQPLALTDATNSRKKVQKRTIWRRPENFPHLRDAVVAKINGFNDDSGAVDTVISRKTLSDNVKLFKLASCRYSVPVESLTSDMVFGWCWSFEEEFALPRRRFFCC
jgi:hypothetical protein